MPITLPVPEAEWLETDGLGGFATGTVSGIRTRRYHGLLVPATLPPAGRTVLVNGFEGWIELVTGKLAISSQRYVPDVVYPDGADRLRSFRFDPWPIWIFELSEGLSVAQEFFVVHGTQTAALSWKLLGDSPTPSTLRIRPLLSGRDFHSSHHENTAFRFDALTKPEQVLWQPYANLPSIEARSNGSYHHEPSWYHDFLYIEEERRGLDCTEDLGSPGYFEWDLADEPAVLILSAGSTDSAKPATLQYESLRQQEKSRRYQLSAPHRLAVDAYIAKRGEGQTVIAGYPWFGDWGRDTFISLRGLCLATGRLDDAQSILVQWATAVSEGMLPNRFPDHGETPEFNSVDASLWYIIAIHDYLEALQNQPSAKAISEADRQKLSAAIEAILTGYAGGTRFGIRSTEDGLLAAGQPGVQLTWMDAKVGDWVITPRVGKPVEVQALWLNSLWVGSRFSSKWQELFAKANLSFEQRFWNEAASGLFDVIDCNHRSGVSDSALRPNQIFAVGGLPLQLIGGERASRLVETVETNLLTPLGLRSLGPKEPAYAPYYEGGPAQRDGSYHQGTVWPWLLGAFVEAWLRIRGNSAEAKAEARTRFLPPLREHLYEAGLNHISEIADAEPPFTPRGCPFQAWSLGEYLRLLALLRDK
jgi:predicted glycogen debranching enzyme